METIIRSEMHPEMHADNPPESLYTASILRKFLDGAAEELDDNGSKQDKCADNKIIMEMLKSGYRYPGDDITAIQIFKDIRAMYESFESIMKTKYANQNISEDWIQSCYSTCFMAVQCSITNEAIREVESINKMAAKAGLPVRPPQQQEGRD